MEGGEANASQEEEKSRQEETGKEESHQEESQEEKKEVVARAWIKKGADGKNISSFFVDNQDNFF